MLKAKFSPPTLPDVVSRPRLLERLQTCQSQPGVWIAGPPGSGKTTLALQYVAAGQLRHFWFRLDGDDMSPAHFFEDLRLLLGSHQTATADLPHFIPDHTQAIDRFARSFFEQIFALMPRPFCLVFDDCHSIPPDSPVHDILAMALDSLPQDSQILFLSRQKPRGELVRHMVNRCLSLLPAGELAFTDEELATFLQTEGITEPPTVARIQQQARGWIAGAVLLLHEQALAGNGMATGERDPELLFEYFTKEIVADYPRPMRLLLVKTALLPRFTPEMAATLSGQSLDSVREDMEFLCRELHFIEWWEHDDSAWFQYHPLFRQFLQAQTDRLLTEAELSRLQQQAAALALESQQLETAVDLLAATGDWGKLVSLCLEHRQALLSSGRSATLLKWIETIPTATARRYPWLMLAHARALSMEDLDGASRRYRDAFTLFREKNDSTGQYLAWAGIASGYAHQWRDLAPIDEHLQRFCELREEYPDYPSLGVQAMVLSCLLSCLNWRRPRGFYYPQLEDECDHLLSELRDPPLRLQLCSGLLWYYCIYGKSAASGHIETLVEQDIGHSGVEPHLAVLFYSVQNLYLAMEGRVDEALAVLQKAESIRLRWGVDGDVTHRIARAFVYLFAGDASAAEDELDTIKAAPKSELEEAFYQVNRGWAANARGDFESALPQLVAAANASRHLGYVAGEAICEFLKIFAYYQTGHEDSTRQALQRLREIRDQVPSVHSDFKVALAESWLAIKDNASDAHISDCLQTALSYGREHGVINYFGKMNSVLSTVYSYALYRNVETDYVLKLINCQGVQPDELGRTLPRWPWPVRIYTLGELAVSVGDEWLDLSRQSARPLQLLRLLISRGRDPIAVPELIELLWPELDGEKGANNYKVTLSRLRKLIGKDAVIQNDNKLSLSRAHVWVDAWVVQGIIRRAADYTANDSELLNLYLRLVSLYRGPFLPNDTEYWLLQYRDRVHQEYLQLLTRYANELVDLGQAEQGLDVAQQGLKIDDSYEPVYIAMLRAYGELKHHTALISLFDQYEKILNSRFHARPSPEIQTVYQEALNKPLN